MACNLSPCVLSSSQWRRLLACLPGKKYRWPVLAPAYVPPSAAGHFEHYVGSLTTPPCSENVQWFVATTYAGVTDAQILDFMTATNGGKGFQINARPIQDFRNDDFKLDVL